jgi:hypothetical protein
MNSIRITNRQGKAKMRPDSSSRDKLDIASVRKHILTRNG